MEFLAKTELPDDYRDIIETLFKVHRLNNAVPFLDAIDKWLPEYKAKHTPTVKPSAGAQKVRRKLNTLQRLLDDLGSETTDILSCYYRGTYPSPRIREEDSAAKEAGGISAGQCEQQFHNQTEKTHLMRLDNSGDTCRIVEIDELINRLALTCKNANDCWQPRRGKPIDPRIGFTLHIMNEFYRFTGETPSSSQDSPFPALLESIFDAVSGRSYEIGTEKPVQSSHRKLIESTFDSVGRFYVPECEDTLLQSKPDLEELL
jgi:hypothetical protein